MSEGVYRLPPDWTLEAASLPLSELVEPYKELAGVPQLQAQTDGSGEIVAILDTGVDAKHVDIAPNLLDAKDFTNSLHGPEDKVGHGSWCTSAIVAAANDAGIRGIAYGAKALHAKVLGDNGSGNDSTIRAGLDWAFKKGAKIFSLSLGGPSMSQWLHDLFREVSRTPGCFVFCAAGNDGGAVNYPAAWPENIAVGAVDAAGKLTQFSSRGDELDILAPGVQLIGAVPGGYARMTGTSMATPLAAGIGTLLTSAFKKVNAGDQVDTLYELLHLLVDTGKQSGNWRIVDPRRLSEVIPLPPAPPTTTLPPVTTTPPPVVPVPPVLPPSPPGLRFPNVGESFPMSGRLMFAGASFDYAGTMTRRA